MMSRKIALSVIFFISASSAFAYYDEDSFPEFMLMGGASTIDAEDTNIIISGTETDFITQTNEGNWEAFTLEAGFGYAYFLTDDLVTGEIEWFPYVTPQINVYYLNGDAIEGNIYENNDPNFNTRSYDMNLQSIRAMFDVGLTVAKINWLSVYAIGGIGVAWNEVSLNAKPNQLGLEEDIEGYELQSENSSGFAYEFGGGLSAELRKDLAITLEYLYSGLTHVELGTSEDNPDFNTEGSHFDVTNQSIMVGLRFAIK